MSMLSCMNISADDFVNFHKAQTQEAIEETKVFSFDSKSKKLPRAIRPLKAGCSWGDLSDSESESESECDSVISVKVTVEMPKMEPTPEEQFEDAEEDEEPEQKQAPKPKEPEQKQTPKPKEPEQKQAPKPKEPEQKQAPKPKEPEQKQAPKPKEPEQSEMKWLTTVKKHTPSQPKQQPAPKPTPQPKQTKQTQKQLEVVETVQQFISFIREGKELERDFTIAPEAHCEHTFKGEICERVFECGKIHIQRCIHSDKCTKRRCTYLHPWDMDSADSEERFIRTMRKYNNRKQQKQVRTC